MGNCKYSENEIVNGIKHEICSNEDLKKINHSDGKSIPCMGRGCRRFDERDDNQDEVKQ